jgi:dehydrogenase/reductase SDR family protein 7B
MKNTFHDKICWVTGASSGIGQAICEVLAAHGAVLVLSARNIQALENLKNKLPNSDKHLVLALDLEQSANFGELTQHVKAKYGRLDFLFNNGGLSQRAEASKTPMEVDRRIMEINYFGNIALTKAVLPVFQEQNQDILS